MDERELDFIKPEITPPAKVETVQQEKTPPELSGGVLPLNGLMSRLLSIFRIYQYRYIEVVNFNPDI
jgi:hypothetical protein